MQNSNSCTKDEKNVTIKRNKSKQNSFIIWCSGRLKDARVHLIQRGTEDLVNHLFWQSMLLTLTTPLARFVRGRWTSGSLLYWGLPFLTWIGWVDVERDDSEEPNFPFYQFVYKTDETVPGIDFAFGLHAFGGLFWILTAWVQIYFLKNSKAWHRAFGVVAILSFVLHMLASIYNLYFDYMKHRPLPRLMLFMICMDSIICMVTSIVRAMRKDITGHRDAMMRCFIYSIEGSGTIRWIANLQELLGVGPTNCQNQWNGLATNCMYSYCWRLMITRCLSMYFLGLFTVQRNSKTFARRFYLELLWSTLIAVFLYNPQRMKTFDMMLQSNADFAIPLIISIGTFVRITILC
eukprot:GFUD01015164.1.p1 GENE.GFUD01015164.1~~GFUD01015164.1.p1  ORF type:complete len:369 (+),score=18.85 GFUD01015164.1:63-1109(+)